VVNDLFQMRGGRGFMTVESQRKSGELGIPVMRMLRDARINLVWEGTSEILRIWMAREALSPYIEQGLAFLQGSSSDKIAAPLYYARMAVRSCLHCSTPLSTSAAFGKEYAQWVRFIESSSRSLTRSTLVATARHRQGLHNKQLLLQELVNDSLWLFSMAATLWYVSQSEMRAKPGIRKLATYFCQEMADRLDPPSSSAKRIRGHTKDTIVYHLSKTIMNGEYAWLEEGIIPLLER
jgi:hypothetical protein